MEEKEKPVIIYFRKKPFENFINDYFPNNYIKPYWKLVDLFDFPVFDRTNNLDIGFKYKNLFQIPQYELSVDYSLFDLIDLRASEILEQNKDKIILVFWSGGIDSTTALTALLKNKNKDNNIGVIMNRFSYNENPYFYNEIIKKQFNLKIFNCDNYILNNEKHCLVTGEYADNLWGTYLFDLVGIDNLYKKEYKKYLVQSLSKEVYEYIEPVLESAPMKLSNSFDVLWWLTFTLRWQTMDFIIRSKIANGFNLNQTKLTHFFQTEMFQLWSMSNVTNRYFSDWKDYKKDLKRYIFEFDKNETYFKNKTKTRSLKNLKGKNKLLFLLSDNTQLQYPNTTDNYHHKLVYELSVAKRFEYLFY